MDNRSVARGDEFDKVPGENPYTLSLGGRNYGFDPGE